MNRMSRVLVVLITIFGIYFGVMYFLFNNDISGDNSNNPNTVEPANKTENTIVLSNNDVFKYVEGNWKIADVNNYAGTKLKVYDGNSYIGENEISYSNRWYINDDNMNFYDLTSSLFAYKGDYIINYKSIDSATVVESDKTIIEDYLAKTEDVYEFENLFLKKYFIDINNNQKKEIVYGISNFETLDKALVGSEFSYFFMVDEDGNIKNIPESNKVECEFALQNLFEMDSKIFMVYSCLYISIGDVTNFIYEYDDEFKLRIDTN